MGQYSKCRRRIRISNIIWSSVRSIFVQSWLNQSRLCFSKRPKSWRLRTHSLPVTPDRVHLFVEADPTRGVAEMANRLKGSTSHLLRPEFVSLRLPPLGSRSDYAGTVGSVSEAVVCQ